MTELTNVTLVDAHVALERKTAEFLKWRRQRREDRERFFTEYERLVATHRQAEIGWGVLMDAIEKAEYDKWKSEATGEDLGGIPLMDLEP